ncbi:MAG: MBL fold metallo-hydrolase [Actinobacteria bacterium]|nr:MBL fold metallo-hydrolase [Actinomycetota bacterium]MBU1943526.1 MBL fold metallo-hydrolase [Actinomycetota bacterium]MBU2686457.1 MBL fold metallo-hydrolase [Actinomycetota bacterium]
MDSCSAAITEIADGVFGLQFDLPLGVQPINVYLLAGDPLTLIDTGPILPGIPDALYRALDEVGYPVGTLGRIIVTHHHLDHMGLAAMLKEASGARVVCHRLGSEILGDYHAEQLRLRDYLVDLAPFVGLDPELARRSFFEPSAWDTAAEPVAVDETVEDGDIIRAGPRDLRVIHTPGHTIDHICLYDPEERLMFTGDMLLQSITPNPDLYPPWLSEKQSGLPDYIDSLHKIREFETGKALPGHGASIPDFEARIDDVLLHHEERLRFLRDDIVEEEKTVLQLAVVLLTHINMEMSPINVFLAMREVFGHLVILERTGEVTMELRDGTAYYRATSPPTA